MNSHILLKDAHYKLKLELVDAANREIHAGIFKIKWDQVQHLINNIFIKYDSLKDIKPQLIAVREHYTLTPAQSRLLDYLLNHKVWIDLTALIAEEQVLYLLGLDSDGSGENNV
jgi:hypothetical protein